MRCEELEQIVFSGREISSREREAMRAHAQVCEACRVLMEHSDVLVDAGALDADVDVPASFAHGWRAAIRERAQNPDALRRLRAWLSGGSRGSRAARVIGYACCAVVLVGVGTQLGMRTPAVYDTAMYSAKTGSSQKYEITGEEMDGGMMSRSMNALSDPDADGSPDDGRRIVRSARLDLTTDNLDAALEAVRAQTAGTGGSITSCDVSGTRESGRYASIELSIPEDALDGFLTETGALGTVTRAYSQAIDMTGQYQDNASRLESAKAQKQRLDELYQSAQSMEDIVTITNALFEVQQQIDSLTGANNAIDQRAANAQISLTITEEAAQEEADVPLTEQLVRQVGQGSQALGELMGNALLFAAWALPWLGSIGVLVLAVLVVMRLRRRR